VQEAHGPRRRVGCEPDHIEANSGPLIHSSPDRNKKNKEPAAPIQQPSAGFGISLVKNSARRARHRCSVSRGSPVGFSEPISGGKIFKMAQPDRLKLRSIGQNDYRVLEGRQRAGRIRYASERTPGIWIWRVQVNVPGQCRGGSARPT
jgi:hypothetical protein